MRLKHWWRFQKIANQTGFLFNLLKIETCLCTFCQDHAQSQVK